MKTTTLVLLVLGVFWAGSAGAQTKSAPAGGTSLVAAAAAKPAPVDLITSRMEQAPPVTDAIRVRADANPLTKRLTVRTDVSGPTRLEINDSQGNPVMTHDLIMGSEAAVLDVSRLSPGYYIVKCTTGTRTGMRRVQMGQ